MVLTGVFRFPEKLTYMVLNFVVRLVVGMLSVIIVPTSWVLLTRAVTLSLCVILIILWSCVSG